MNGKMEVNVPIYANGPVYVQGIDIKKELEDVKSKLENIDEKHEKRLVEILKLVVVKADLRPDEESAIKTVIGATDWAQRLVFWKSCLEILAPFTRIAIFKFSEL